MATSTSRLVRIDAVTYETLDWRPRAPEMHERAEGHTCGRRGVEDLLLNLVGQPAVNVTYLKNTLGLGEMAALRALDSLTEREVLTESTGKSRGRVWQHQGIFDALDSYGSVIAG